MHFPQADEPAAASALRNSAGVGAGATEFSLFLTAHTRASKPSRTSLIPLLAKRFVAHPKACPAPVRNLGLDHERVFVRRRSMEARIRLDQRNADRAEFFPNDFLERLTALRSKPGRRCRSTSSRIVDDALLIAVAPGDSAVMVGGMRFPSESKTWPGEPAVAPTRPETNGGDREKIVQLETDVTFASLEESREKRYGHHRKHPARLVLQSGSTTLTLDKEAGKVSMQRKVLFWNRSPIERGLADITDATVDTAVDRSSGVEVCNTMLISRGRSSGSNSSSLGEFEAIGYARALLRCRPVGR